MTAPALVIPEATRARLAELFARFRRPGDALLTALYIVQADCNHLSDGALTELAALMEMPKSVIYEVVTFYSLYSTAPRGRNIIMVCQNLCCYLRGADALFAAVEAELGIRPGETTADGRFTFTTAECLALCDRAPALQINEQVFGPVDPAVVGDILRRFP